MSENRKESTYQVDLDRAVDLYGDMVYRIAMTYTKNGADAQDVFQDTFLRLVKYRETIESEEHLKAWLVRVAVNCAKSFVTSNWNKTTEGMEENPASEPVFETEEQSFLYEMILQLPEKTKLSMLLYYYEGYSVKEIAVIIEEKENTVKSYLNRGRKKLKQELEKEGYRL